MEPMAHRVSMEPMAHWGNTVSREPMAHRKVVIISEAIFYGRLTIGISNYKTKDEFSTDSQNSLSMFIKM